LFCPSVGDDAPFSKRLFAYYLIKSELRSWSFSYVCFHSRDSFTKLSAVLWIRIRSARNQNFSGNFSVWLSVNIHGEIHKFTMFVLVLRLRLIPQDDHDDDKKGYSRGKEYDKIKKNLPYLTSTFSLPPLYSLYGEEYSDLQ
jgi:hypothetical protein